MNWLSLKLWLTIALAAVSTFAVFLWNANGRLQAEAQTFETKLQVAESANAANVAMVKALEAERDAFVLKRAVEKQQADELVAESEANAKAAKDALAKSKQRIADLSKEPDCIDTMQRRICYAIEQELRAL